MTPLRSRSTDRAGRRDHRQVCGNPFSFLRVLRILSRYALGMTYRLAIATIVECAASRRLVIAKVRVSGGHLCKAEAPTEPAGEICKRLWQSVFLFKGITDSFALTTLAVPKSCYLLGARTTFHRGVRRCSLFPALQRKQRHSE